MTITTTSTDRERIAATIRVRVRSWIYDHPLKDVDAGTRRMIVAIANDLADAILALSVPSVGPEPVAWRTRGMLGNDEWDGWRLVSEAQAHRLRLDPATKNGRRQVEPLFAHPPAVPATGDQGRVEALEAALGGLVAIVRGECPSLLNEDSGGDAELSLTIDALLSGSTPKPAGVEIDDAMVERAARAFCVSKLWNPDDEGGDRWRDVADDVRAAITAALSAPGEGALIDGWLPIESAPRDGTAILAGHAHSVFDVYWPASDGSDGQGAWVDGATDNYGDLTTYDPTHWMPLPAPPLTPSDGAA